MVLIEYFQIIDIVALLMKRKGAPLDAKDKNGMTALDIAKSVKDEQIMCQIEQMINRAGSGSRDKEC
jgi:ankyrin repeat protein